VAAFGYAREDVVGRSMADLIIPQRYRDAHNHGFAHYLAGGEGRILGKRRELAAIRADGTEFPIELAIASIATGPTPMFTAFIRDITARKESEGRIKRLNRVYAVLSGINTLIVRVRDRESSSARRAGSRSSMAASGWRGSAWPTRRPASCSRCGRG
jgi:PAS domain S-box-containing protein